MARWTYLGIGVLLLLFLVLQIAAFIYLKFNPIKINLHF